jgi:hypothetical protein
VKDAQQATTGRTKTAKPRAQLLKHRGSAWTNRLGKEAGAPQSLQVSRNQQQRRVLPHLRVIGAATT